MELMADLLTTREVQDLLHVDRTTVYRMVESGQIPAMRVGKQWRFAPSDLERWLRGQAAHGAAQSPSQPGLAPVPSIFGTASKPDACLSDLLPISCVQMIQDAFADALGVMIVVTDMDGRPVTRVSNSCGLYDTVMESGEAVARCIQHWQQMAGALTLEPKFAPSDLGLLCARGLIRMGNELKGMVFLGGIAPDDWPPDDNEIVAIAEHFGLEPMQVQSKIGAVHRLDSRDRDRALGFVQRIADICSHVLEDRSVLYSRLQAIAMLTTL
jgi:excisionase family DNA binding protein